jgi:hypothetical protein
MEVAAGSVRGLGKVLPAMVEAGWIATRKHGLVIYVRLTEAGVAERAKQAPPAPARSRSAHDTSEPSSAARIAALEAAVAALTARVAALEAPTAVAIDPAQLRADVLTALGDVDARTRGGGLVAIPDLRAELRRRGAGASDRDVDQALEALEREWSIDLSVAQDPSLVPDRAAGIERPGRGLLYYVARR